MINALTNAALADQIGLLDDQVKELTAQLSALKDEAKARGIDKVEGRLFVVSIDKSIAATLDTASLKKEFGQQWYDDRCKLGERTTLRIKPVPGAISTLAGE